ncbi:2,3-bisphosphoglycerate-independent phosphoglycerate mutase (fragment) [Desulfamplus magnetovallimortis]|uniref:2,3-bisphosphoglycerate-independent phosphoglycerate mutase n=1 Tax=Desulfamplus magnetovallimortis TaxID=1246637 RepID=A0A1W1H9G1_9BACT
MEGKKIAVIKENDAVIFFNFRADRAREISRSLTEEPATFTFFKRETILEPKRFLTMTQYEESFQFPVIFTPQRLDNILGEVISSHGLSQLRIAETEKYAHVTYFFNGGDEKIFPLEERVLIPSPREVRTYDEKPEMSAREVADKACEMIHSGRFRFIVLNFANMDMVGHTGNLDAAIKACSTVDECVKKVLEAIWSTGGTAMVTADHGNAEQMKDSEGNPHTAHTLNPVRFILAGEKYAQSKVAIKNGILGDIAPTVLKVMGLEQPADMTGTPLF